MLFFDRNNKLFKPDSSYHFLGSGGCSKVYTNGENIFKIYFKETLPEHKLDEEVFEFLKTAKFPCLMEIYEIYRKSSLKKRIDYNSGFMTFPIDAYLGKYYESDCLNILFKNKDYLLESLKEMEKLFDAFTEYLIAVDDVKFENSICTENGIVITDPDCFRKAFIIDGLDTYSGITDSTKIPLYKEDLIINNKQALIDYVANLLYVNSDKLGSSFIEDKKNLLIYLTNWVTSLEVSEKTNVTDLISKELKYVRTPGEYLIRR